MEGAGGPPSPSPSPSSSARPSSSAEAEAEAAWDAKALQLVPGSPAGKPNVFRQLLRVLKMTEEEYGARRRTYLESKRALRQALRDPATTNADKHHLSCDHLMHRGRVLFVCQGCWMTPANCICEKMVQASRASPRVKVFILMHHNEWGRASNR